MREAERVQEITEYKSQEITTGDTEKKPNGKQESVDDESEFASAFAVPRGFESAMSTKQCVMFGIGCW